jgi:hypothetical protein
MSQHRSLIPSSFEQVRSSNCGRGHADSGVITLTSSCGGKRRLDGRRYESIQKRSRRQVCLLCNVSKVYLPQGSMLNSEAFGGLIGHLIDVAQSTAQRSANRKRILVKCVGVTCYAMLYAAPWWPVPSVHGLLSVHPSPGRQHIETTPVFAGQQTKAGTAL